MKVYLHSAQAKRGSHTMYVAPAGDPRGIRGGVSADWLDESGAPKMITVEFERGAATVPDDLGRYMVRCGIAKRSSLILPRFLDAA